MFRIAICDDDKIVCNEIETMIKNYADNSNSGIEVDVFYSAKNLYSQIKESGSYDLIFLDIEMAEWTGIEFGRRLREIERDEMTKIVFISGMDNYAMDLFRIRPQDFLKKPIQQMDVGYNIEKSIELLGEQKKYFLYKFDHDTKKIPTVEILYFESSNRVVIAHTIKGDKIFYEKLEDVEKRVDGKYFWRIHKSYLIHVMHTRKLEPQKVYIDNGKELPVSQTYRAKVKKLQLALLGKG